MQTEWKGASLQLLPTSLIYFREVAGTGSITEAAEVLHVSPSAISRQMSKLESSAGAPLFLRHPRGMLLTEAGRLLLAHARRSELEGESLLQELRDAESRRTSVIKVASAEGLAHCRVPAAIARMVANYSDVVFNLVVVPSAEATRQVIDGKADIAAVFALGPQRDVTVEFSLQAPALAAVTRDHRLAGRSSVSLRELCEDKLALPGRGITQRELFDIAVQREGLSAEIVLETDQVGPILAFARSGVGVALMSRFTVPAGEDSGLVFIPVDNTVFLQREGQIQTMAGRRKSALVTAFASALADELMAE